MKAIFLFCVAATLTGSVSYAKIFRLGYTGIPVAGVDFTDGQYTQLEEAASAGDTVQVYGNISGILVSKRLVFIGFGYNFDKNTGLQNTNLDAPSNVQIYFLPGSDSSIAEGLAGFFMIGNQDPEKQGVGVSKVIIRRCFGAINFFVNNGPVSDVKILSCVATGISQQQQDLFNVTNLLISNSIFSTISLYNAGSSATIVNCSSEPGDGRLFIDQPSCLVKNSILALYVPNNNIVYENNIFSQSQPAILPPGTNNRWGQSYENIFNRLGGTDDEPASISSSAFAENYYLLKAGSPAINGGFNNANAPTDCGIFGGEPAYVYKLSGVPAVPAIYKLEAPTLSAGTNPYNVTISVRSNN